ncbi:MAG TPA: pilus assembly PilX N-terminal domain-containing protein [Kofleriaceae bacterium]|nr:pilus assembly PilX N-terminal domain-containing protein [Kofleriaceae bacterium]
MPRNRERGNTMVLALIVMSALATLGALTVVSVQSSLKSSTADRSQSIALYAAESGAASAMEYLRYRFDATRMTIALPPPGVGTWGDPPWNLPKGWSRFVTAGNVAVPDVVDAALFGANVLPGAGTPFDNDLNAWFTIKILNNRDDRPPPYLQINPTPGNPIAADCATPLVFPGPLFASLPNGFTDGVDYDGRVIIQATGHGPQGATAILEVEVEWPVPQATANENCPQSDVFPNPDVDPPIHPYPDPALVFQPAGVPAPPNGPPLTLLGWHVVNL